MHSITLIFLFIIVIVILIIALVYATDAAAAIGTTNDPDLGEAHHWLAWTVSIIWITIALVIIGIISLIIFGPEFLPLFGKTIVYLFLAGMIFAIIAVGIAASVAAAAIHRSAAKSTVGNAYEDAVIAAVVSLGSIALALIAAGVTWYHGKTPEENSYTDPENPYPNIGEFGELPENGANA